jgi:hypothetical protein
MFLPPYMVFWALKVNASACGSVISALMAYVSALSLSLGDRAILRAEAGRRQRLDDEEDREGQGDADECADRPRIAFRRHHAKARVLATVAATLAAIATKKLTVT